MNSLKHKSVITILIYVLLFSTHCFALHEGDFFLSIDQCDQIQTQTRIKAQEVNLGNGFATSNPGFDCGPGVFPTGSKIGFNILAPLMKWDDANELFYALDHNTQETMVVSFLSLWTQTSDTAVNGFELPVASDGSYHRHYGFTLVGHDSSDPCDGIYLLEMELYNTSLTVEKTDPLMIVFNNGTDESVNIRATEWVEDNLIYFADIDDSNVVDFADFAILAKNLNYADCNCVNDWCSGADIDEDGFVDVNDMYELSDDWLYELLYN